MIFEGDLSHVRKAMAAKTEQVLIFVRGDNFIGHGALGEEEIARVPDVLDIIDHSGRTA